MYSANETLALMQREISDMQKGGAGAGFQAIHPSKIPTGKEGVWLGYEFVDDRDAPRGVKGQSGLYYRKRFYARNATKGYRGLHKLLKPRHGRRGHK